jgi:hypothetical protein
VPLGIDEHIFHALETGQIPHVVRERLVGLLERGNRFL